MASKKRQPIIPETLTHAAVSDRISGIVLEQPSPVAWKLAFFVSAVLVFMLLAALTVVFTTGVGLFGVNIPVAWGFPIVNTVWWIGIAHAGTLISAVLLLTRQHWRASINRLAEAMAMFAIVCAGIYPLLHLGRPWLAYYLSLIHI